MPTQQARYTRWHSPHTAPCFVRARGHPPPLLFHPDRRFIFPWPRFKAENHGGEGGATPRQRRRRAVLAPVSAGRRRGRGEAKAEGAEGPEGATQCVTGRRPRGLRRAPRCTCGQSSVNCGAKFERRKMKRENRTSGAAEEAWPEASRGRGPQPTAGTARRLADWPRGAADSAAGREPRAAGGPVKRASWTPYSPRPEHLPHRGAKARRHRIQFAKLLGAQTSFCAA